MDMHYFEDFEEMLEHLNDLLVRENASIEIRAIGGFAMMCNAQVMNFDSRNASVDIDSYNQYTDKIKGLIEEVANVFEVNKDWLNTDWRDEYLLKYYSEDGIILGLKEWKWVAFNEFNLSNISITYANIEGIFAMKCRAIHERILKREEPRLNDIVDALAILKIDALENIPKVELSKVLDHFYLAKEHLNTILETKGANKNEI